MHSVTLSIKGRVSTDAPTGMGLADAIGRKENEASAAARSITLGGNS